MTTQPTPSTAAPPDSTLNQPDGAATHQALTELIANALATGITHPGDPTNGVRPHMIQLPMFKTVGLPPQMAAAVKEAAREIAQAILALITTNHQITPKTVDTNQNP
jgi:hypothetical protein